MARIAKQKTEAGAPKLRLVYDATKQKTDSESKKVYTSSLAEQLDRFADNLDREIEFIKKM